MVGAVFLALTLARRFGFADDRFVLECPAPAGALNAEVAGLLSLGAVGLYLGLTWHQEFPFLGDHDYHLGTSWAALEFWSKWAPWVVAVFASATVATLIGRPRYWPLAAFALLLGSSIFFARPSDLFARYPALGYFVDAPFNRLFRWLDSPSPLNALRLANACSVIAWLFVLRPIFLKRWPSFDILPFALF